MYDGSLVTFPGTGTDPVVRLESVDGAGIVQPGEEAIESTEAEVSRVVELVLEHARARPHESLGVIALGIRHATRLDDALRRALASEAAAGVGDFFDEDRPERFFVKNLERVQGDERDAIILSVGYGKTPHGRVLHRFGPLNLEGGERRLNVAITRARRRMTVVSALVASDLDPARLKSRGSVMLRDFLAYAADGSFPPPAPLTEQGEPTPPTQVSHPNGTSLTQVSHPDGTSLTVDPLRAEFARRLRGTGLVVHEAYGSAGQPIDLAVEDPDHPGHVLVAVETDGPGYAAMRSSRDRDRLRGEQLGRLGWMHVRVWTPDLFRDPARDVARVNAAVQQAVANRPANVVPAPAGPAPTGAAPAGTATRTEQTAATARTEQTAATAAAGTDEGQQVLPLGDVPDEDRPEAGAGEPADDGEFVPASDDGARQRRVRGRKATRPAQRSTPEQTKDDTDLGWGEQHDESAHDRWLREQRPPHWGSD
jgi:hypothetical protein